MTDAMLTVNAGSSSVKFAVFERRADPVQVLHGKIDGIGGAVKFEAKDADGKKVGGHEWGDGNKASHDQVFAHLLQWVQEHLGGDRLVGAGHRVVHGGRKLDRPKIIDAAVLAEIEALVSLAPLHQPQSLQAIHAVQSVAPDMVQVACFDTSFHLTMPAVARRLALPRAITEQGVERYGFHGISYEYIASTLPSVAPALAGGRVVVAHLGNGASLCALHAGRSVDTTMGLTALDGLPMGTRCGTLDPGAVLYLLQARGMSADAVSDMLYHQSGLLGVSGVASDYRVLEKDGSAAAQEAIELFAFQIVRQTGALMASMGGLDGIVFTAGIGENVPELRRLVCARLEGLGVLLDDAANTRGGPCISQKGSRASAWVIPTDEETMIARHMLDVLPE
jgi:acetate kinase